MAHGEYELTLFLRVVKPFVGGIKLRQNDDQYPHPPDRPMPHTRSDHDAHADAYPTPRYSVESRANRLRFTTTRSESYTPSELAVE